MWYNEASNKVPARCERRGMSHRSKPVTTSNSITIPLTQGLFTVVDEIDGDFATIKLHAHFNLTSGPYAAKHGHTDKGHRALVIHRIIMARILGRPLQRSEAVDHVNGNPLDNRRINLRLASKSQNAANAKLRSDNSSGYKGVCWSIPGNRWRAYARANGKQIHLGYYDTAEDAHQAYCKFAEEHYGEFARLK